MAFLNLLQTSDESRLRQLCRQYAVRTLKVFGSVARGDETEQSDIDLLVEFEHPVTLPQLINLEREMSKLFGRPVDLVTEQSLSPYLQDSVIASAREILSDLA